MYRQPYLQSVVVWINWTRSGHFQKWSHLVHAVVIHLFMNLFAEMMAVEQVFTAFWQNVPVTLILILVIHGGAEAKDVDFCVDFKCESAELGVNEQERRGHGRKLLCRGDSAGQWVEENDAVYPFLVLVDCFLDNHMAQLGGQPDKLGEFVGLFHGGDVLVFVGVA